MKAVELQPAKAAQLIYKSVARDEVTLQEIDTETRTAIVRINNNRPAGIGLDFMRCEILHKRIIDSQGEGTSAREVMESVGGLWSIEFLG